MGWQLSLRPRQVAIAIRDHLERPMAFVHRKNEPAESWPLYEVPRRDSASPYTSDSSHIIDDMVAVLSTNRHGSTAEALAFLRQVYPKYPLTLRLAALVVHSKNAPFEAEARQLEAAE
jgi:hypothetical protein